MIDFVQTTQVDLTPLINRLVERTRASAARRTILLRDPLDILSVVLRPSCSWPAATSGPPVQAVE
jgi:hypothetical protein